MLALPRPTLRLPTPTTSNQAEQPDGGTTVRLRLDLGYDGTDFHGWADQPGLRTVQGTVQLALHLMLRASEQPVLTVAGRTDAGVHASGQVAHVDVAESAWAAAAPKALRRLSRLLPVDIRVHQIAVAQPGFDARFSALWRRYRYRICDQQHSADPLRRRDTLWHPRPLDLDQMNAAAVALIGEHDFAAFCRPRPGASTVRELLRLDWRRSDSGIVTGTVIADAFCHNMVRALTGALLAVGDGRKPTSWPASVLAATVRDPAVVVAPPHPLCLAQVGYPPDDQLAARASSTRQIRSPSPKRPDPASRLS